MSPRSIPQKADFRDALQMCSDADNQELIPIDKLRYFHKENVNMIDGDERGLFRINAIKHSGKWYEYLHGGLQEIDFSYFEDFNPNEGENGRHQNTN